MGLYGMVTTMHISILVSDTCTQLEEAVPYLLLFLNNEKKLQRLGCTIGPHTFLPEAHYAYLSPDIHVAWMESDCT